MMLRKLARTGTDHLKVQGALRTTLRRSGSTAAAASAEPSVSVTVNGKTMQVPKSHTVLQACDEANVYVPTLCTHPNLRVTGTCRLCLVEVDGRTDKLWPACATPVTDGMTVKTNSPEVTKTVKQNLQLMLSDHPNACATCEADGNCEYQDLIHRYHLEEKWPKQNLRHEWDDYSSHAIVRDLDKCIKCGRCVRACSDLQGMDVLGFIGRGQQRPVPYTGTEIGETDCIECGQCALYCPVGAISEHPDWQGVLEKLQNKDPNVVHVAQTAPAVRVAIGEEFRLESRVSTEQMVYALRKLGFDYVFDTNFSADLCIMEEGTELIHRLKNGGPFPMFTSCCPGWVNLVEKSYPEFIPNLSSCRSPQAMESALIKSYWAKKTGYKPENIHITSFMPCTAKKAEAIRPQLHGETDVVLTTRELGKMLRNSHIRFPDSSSPEVVEGGKYDDPLGKSTGAAIIFGATGGVMEAALRTAYELVTGDPLPGLVYEPARGLDSVKEASVDVGGTEVRIAIVNGTGATRHLLDEIKQGKKDYHFVEVMACRGGCIGGGGQPKSLDKNVLQKRIKAIYSDDERHVLRKSHENQDVQQLYKEFLGEPLGHKSHELLHTHYEDKSHKQ